MYVAHSTCAAARQNRRCLSDAGGVGGLTAVHRWSRDGSALSQAPSSLARYGQTFRATATSESAWPPRVSPTGTVMAYRIPEPWWPTGSARKRKNPGDDLFSRKAALSVSSALESL